MTLGAGSFEGSVQASAPSKLTSPWPVSPLYQILPQTFPEAAGAGSTSARPHATAPSPRRLLRPSPSTHPPPSCLRRRSVESPQPPSPARSVRVDGAAQGK